MKKKRLIPILLLKNGSLVQSKSFNNFQIIGSAIPAVKRLSEWGSDELIYLDISRDNKYDLNRDDLKFVNAKNILDIINHVSKQTFMPITIGGKIKNLNDIELRLEKCADKVSINTASFLNKNLIYNASKEFGSQCIVASVDVKIIGSEYMVFINNGKTNTNLKMIEWVQNLQDMGAGEILINSIDRDGMGLGYDIDLISKIKDIIKIPLIICGGVGKYDDFKEGLKFDCVDAVAASNIFHFRDLSVYYAKKMLYESGFNVRKSSLLKV